MAEPSNQWRRGGNWSTQRKPLVTSFRKCHIPQPEDSSPKRDSNPRSTIGGRLGKQTCKSLHHASLPTNNNCHLHTVCLTGVSLRRFTKRITRLGACYLHWGLPVCMFLRGFVWHHGCINVMNCYNIYARKESQTVPPSVRTLRGHVMNSSGVSHKKWGGFSFFIFQGSF